MHGGDLTPANAIQPYAPAQGIAPWAMTQAPEAPHTKVNWSVYWRSINERRGRILLFAVIPTVIAFWYANSVQPVYRSTSTLLIESVKAKILSIEDVYGGASQDREYYQTQVEILRSRDVALRTVTNMKLWDEPEFDPRRPVRSLQGKVKDFFSPPPPPPKWTTQALAEATVPKFLQAVSIEPVRLSQLVKISADAMDRELAAKMADATAINFIESDRDSRLKLNLNVTEQLQERLAAQREKLLQSETELQKFREASGLVNVGNIPGIAGQEMSEISQRLVQARVKRTELESAYAQAQRGGGDFVNQPGYLEAQTRVSLAQLHLDELTNTMGDKNSKVIEARAALDSARKALGSVRGSGLASIRAEMQAARETEKALQTALDSSRSAVQGVNRKEFQLGVLEREVSTNKQLYDLLLSRTKETGVSTNLQGAVARIVDPAVPPTSPLRPNKTQIIVVTLLLSLSFGAAAAILIDKVKNTLQGSEEAEQRLHHPVLASLPLVRTPDGQSKTRLFLEDPMSAHADGIRAARTNMLLSNFAVSRKLVLVTSAVEGEGKTTFCTNFAFAHAQTKRTLLIDCDLRNPQIGARLGLPPDAKGLSDLVLGLEEAKDCVHPIYGSPLLVMPAGSVSVHPEEFLLSASFQEALRSLANRVDIVLIDSPAVDVSSDALIIAQQANDTIYVVKAHETPHMMAQRGLDRLRRAGASVLGLVLNNADAIEKKATKRQVVPNVFDASRALNEASTFEA
jgi:capsular exopolysaccharide synthesis family protein